MDNKNLDRFYADNNGLIHTVVNRCIGRFKAIGSTMDYEELYQELSEVFIKAYDKFDETTGNKFSTYFMTCAFNRVNKMAEAVEIERIHNGVRSFEEMNGWMEEGDGAVEETIPSGYSTPEEIVGAASLVKAMMSDLSPLAAKIAEMAIDPPDFMEHEFEAAQVHAELSRSRGIEKRARGSLNVSFVCSVLEKTIAVPPAMLRSAKAEVLNYAERNWK